MASLADMDPARMVVPEPTHGRLAELAFTVGGKPKTLPWSTEREAEFRHDMETAPGWSDWRREFEQTYGERPNLNDPDYNYRLAWLLGAAPVPYEHDGGRHHGFSSTPIPPYREPADLKGPGHPTAWMEHFLREYGVDPHEAPPEVLADALRRGVMPGLPRVGAME